MFHLLKYLQWRLASRNKALKYKSLSPLTGVYVVQLLCSQKRKKNVNNAAGRKNLVVNDV